MMETFKDFKQELSSLALYFRKVTLTVVCKRGFVRVDQKQRNLLGQCYVFYMQSYEDLKVGLW